MKYQVIKRLKTKSKLVALCDTLAEAHEITVKHGGTFTGFNYIGGFPHYKDEKGYPWQIQGQVEELKVVCPLNEEEKLRFYEAISRDQERAAVASG